jgi:UDP-N-acetylglucosamine 4-epimerase
MLIAARDAGVKRFVYASSSSVYGDSKELPKRVERIGSQLSPYAVSKYGNELYAQVFGRCYGMETIGLRYFNVFGPRQDPYGPYAAVIPRWIDAIKKGAPVQIYGDGRTSRDFCYVDNAIQANLLAGLTKKKKASNKVYNVACGNKTSLNELYHMIRLACRTRLIKPLKVSNREFARDHHALPTAYRKQSKFPPARHLPERNGDVRHSLASLVNSHQNLGFKPTLLIGEGIKKAICE